MHRAFGPFGSALCGWCLWVNNLFYFPALLLFAAANAAAMFGDLAPGLGDNRLFSTIFVLGFLWFTVSISIQGFEAGRWLQNVGVIGTWVPVALLIVGAAVVAGTLGSQTSLAPSAMVPRVDAFGTISLWSGFCFAFAGFEIGAFASQEIHNPERTLPRGIAISGLIVTLIYIAGTVAVLIIVPSDVLAERSGIADAVDAAATQYRACRRSARSPRSCWPRPAIAGCASWMAGSARVAYAAAREGQWPAPLGALHPRYRTPHVALIAQGVIATLIFLSSLFLTIGGGTTTVQESYDILVNLTIVVYFVPYVYLFLGLTRLLKGPELTLGLRTRGRGRPRRDGDLDDPRLRAAVGHGQRPQLRGQPDLADRRGRSPAASVSTSSDGGRRRAESRTAGRWQAPNLGPRPRTRYSPPAGGPSCRAARSAFSSS